MREKLRFAGSPVPAKSGQLEPCRGQCSNREFDVGGV